jgi:hypothetical protein
MPAPTQAVDTAGVQPTPDDWDATALLNGPTRDGQPPPRSYWPRLVAGFAALLVAAVLIVAAIRFVLPTPSGPTRAEGEQRLRAIALPDGWQRSTISYNDSLWSPETGWSEEIMANSGDLDAVADTLNEAIRAAGFTSAGCHQGNPDASSCDWYARDFALTSSVHGFAPLLEAPCPTGMSECAQVWLSLTHRTKG